MSQVIRDLAEWRKVRAQIGNHSLGFVPTMGALHAGHTSLATRSVQENTNTVATVFVNPSQFNKQHDLDTYPKDLDADAIGLHNVGVDYVLAPSAEAMYQDGYRYRISETQVSLPREGEFRPAHFDGVLTVIMKFLHLVRPNRIYFGEKDYQQFELVRDMVRAFFMDVDVVPCPTVREHDGLAMSSRNRNLSAEGRILAGKWAQIFQGAGTPNQIRDLLTDSGVTVEYIEDHEDRRYGAVVIGGVRLIDNRPL